MTYIPRFRMHVQRVFSPKRQHEGSAESDEDDSKDHDELGKVMGNDPPKDLGVCASLSAHSKF